MRVHRCRCKECEGHDRLEPWRGDDAQGDTHRDVPPVTSSFHMLNEPSCQVYFHNTQYQGLIPAQRHACSPVREARSVRDVCHQEQPPGERWSGGGVVQNRPLALPLALPLAVGVLAAGVGSGAVTAGCWCVSSNHQLRQGLQGVQRTHLHGAKRCVKATASIYWDALKLCSVQFMVKYAPRMWRSGETPASGRVPKGPVLTPRHQQGAKRCARGEALCLHGADTLLHSGTYPFTSWHAPIPLVRSTGPVLAQLIAALQSPPRAQWSKSFATTQRARPQPPYTHTHTQAGKFRALHASRVCEPQTP